MKKGTKILLGVIAFIGVAVAAFFLFVKDKVTSNPLTGNSAGNSSEVSVLSEKIKSVEAALNSRISSISTTNSRPEILKNAGNPVSTSGTIGDFYINTNNAQVFVKTTNTLWESVGTDSQVREMANKLVELSQSNTGTIVIDVLDYDLPVVNNVQGGEGTEGGNADGEIRDVLIKIFPINFPLVSSPVTIYPIYKFLNAPCNLSIALSNGTPFYTTVITDGDTLYPINNNGNWTYIKA